MTQAGHVAGEKYLIKFAYEEKMSIDQEFLLPPIAKISACPKSVDLFTFIT